MRDLARLGGEGRCGEIWVFQCIDGIDSFAPVQLEKLCQERDRHRALAIVESVNDLTKTRWSRCMVGNHLLLEYLCKVARFMTKALHAVASWERAPPRHVLLGRGPHQGEDELSLIQITAARENRLSLKHLTKDAPARIRSCIHMYNVKNRSKAE
jgi:hypothetical protein